MPEARSESEPHSRRVSLHMGASPQAAWENVVRPWFDNMSKQTLKSDLPAAVVTASRSQGYFFRNRLIAEGKSLFAVKFLSPPQLRELLLRDRDLRVPLREHLRLLLATIAEAFATKNESEQAVLVAKSIARDPDRFLRAIDELRAAGWAFDEIDSPTLRDVAAQFDDAVHRCGFTFVHDADRALLAHARNSQPLFGNLLVSGFDGGHWPLWPLLHAATLSSIETTVLLSDPRDDARNLDETWIGTWEENFGPAEIISSAKESSTTFPFESLPLRASNISFVVGRDMTQQARAIVALSAKFLAEPQCERLGILFPGPGALPRLVGSFLQSAKIPHNDGIAHLGPSALDDDAWRAWLELQKTPRLKALLRFLHADQGQMLDALSLPQVEETLRRAYSDVLVDDIELLHDYCASTSDLRHGQAAAQELAKIQLLPESGSLNEFLSQTRTIFLKFHWRERWHELERLSRNWSDRVATKFSKRLYLQWLSELLGAPSLERDDFGRHPYALVHLLTYGDAQSQPWSHLIFAGLNDEAWPGLNDELPFVRDEQIDNLNQQNKKLNQRASRRGGQGEGHWSLREGKTLLLGHNEQRQIRRRQLLNLVESVTEKIGASASLYSEATPSRIANPTDFFSWLYFNTYHRGVSQHTLHSLEEQTRDWLKDWSPVDSQKVDSISVGRTGYAFKARRQLRSAGEYEFVLKNPPDQNISLRVTQWEQALRWPAIVWMDIFLGVRADDDRGDAWPVATGQWVHRWLAASVGNGGERKFFDVNRANENRGRILQQAHTFRERIAVLCTNRGKVLPDWWRSGWSNALYIADCLAAKVSNLDDWSEMAVEWSLAESSIPLAENGTLRVRGRIDLILARQKCDQAQIGYEDLWVVDYKTGRQRAFNLKERRGKETSQQKFYRQLIEGRGVQLALYALAVHALGAREVQLTLLSPDEQLEPQFRLGDVLAQKDFWKELHRMQETGVFGMLGPIHTNFGFVETYPLATLPIDTDLLKEKWALTHPAFAEEEESK